MKLKNLTYQEDKQTDFSFYDRIEMSAETDIKRAI